MALGLPLDLALVAISTRLAQPQIHRVMVALGMITSLLHVALTMEALGQQVVLPSLQQMSAVYVVLQQ